MSRYAVASVPAIVAPASVLVAFEPPKGLANEVAAKVKALAESNGNVAELASVRKAAAALKTSSCTMMRALAVLAASGAIVSNADGLLVKLAA